MSREECRNKVVMYYMLPVQSHNLQRVTVQIFPKAVVVPTGLRDTRIFFFNEFVHSLFESE